MANEVSQTHKDKSYLLPLRSIGAAQIGIDERVNRKRIQKGRLKIRVPQGSMKREKQNPKYKPKKDQ